MKRESHFVVGELVEMVGPGDLLWIGWTVDGWLSGLSRIGVDYFRRDEP